MSLLQSSVHPYLSHLPDQVKEQAAVRLCSREELVGKQRRTLRKILRGSALRWSSLVDEARFHGVLGLCYHHLAQHAADRVPEEIMDEMHQVGQSIQFQNLRLMRELVRLAEQFAAAEMPLLSFKGPLLAQRTYGNLAFRRFGDVDLLVRSEDREAAEALLRAEGYESLRDLSAEEAHSFQREHLGHEYYHPERQVVVELHTELLNRTLSFGLDAASVWERAVRRPLGTAHIYELSPPDLLLYLCAHGTKHHWCRLLWVADVAQVLRHHPDLDWPALVQQARDIGSLRILLLGVALAHRWLDAPVPAPVLREIDADPRIDTLIQEIDDRWFGTEEGLVRDAGWATFWFAVRTRQRLRDNRSMILHYLWLAVTPTDNDRAFAGPTLPEPLLYLVRPLRLLLEGMGWQGRKKHMVGTP